MMTIVEQMAARLPASAAELPMIEFIVLVLAGNYLEETAEAVKAFASATTQARRKQGTI